MSLLCLLQGKLSEDRREQLDAIGFQWAVQAMQYEEKWSRMYGQLMDYHRETGHCKVPQHYSSNPVLGRWVKTQRCLNNEVRYHLS